MVSSAMLAFVVVWCVGNAGTGRRLEQQAVPETVDRQQDEQDQADVKIGAQGLPRVVVDWSQFTGKLLDLKRAPASLLLRWPIFG
jgi:hypothetical protein